MLTKCCHSLIYGDKQDSIQAVFMAGWGRETYECEKSSEVSRGREEEWHRIYFSERVYRGPLFRCIMYAVTFSRIMVGNPWSAQTNTTEMQGLTGYVTAEPSLVT